MARTKGAKGDKFWTEAIRVEVMRDVEHDGEKVKRLRKIAYKLCTLAEEGDVAAIKEIGDRLDGKATQPVDNNVMGELIIEVVARENPSPA